MALVWKYAVLFCRVGSEKAETMEWYGESEAEAINDVREVLGNPQFVYAKAKPLMAVIDWSRGSFNKEEAAEYLRMKRVDDLMADGRLPKCPNGKPAWLRSSLDRLIDPERKAA